MANRVHLDLLPAQAAAGAVVFPFPGIRPPEGEPHTQYQAAYAVESYVVVDGLPRVADQVGVAQTSTASAAEDKVHSGAGIPAPSTYATGATWRFLPTASAWTAYAGVWKATGGNDYPQIRWLPTPVPVQNDPEQLSSRPYHSSTSALVSGPSLRAKGGNASVLTPAAAQVGTNKALIAGRGRYAGATQLLVCIPRDSDADYYNLLEANTGANGSAGGRVEVRWVKGRVELVVDYAWRLQYSPYLTPGQPVVVALSMDAVTGIGRLVIVGGQRTSRTFSFESSNHLVELFVALGSTSVTGVSGSVQSGRNGVLDFLEVDVWTRALDQAELDRVASDLAWLYRAAT